MVERNSVLLHIVYIYVLCYNFKQSIGKFLLTNIDNTDSVFYNGSFCSFCSHLLLLLFVVVVVCCCCCCCCYHYNFQRSSRLLPVAFNDSQLFSSVYIPGTFFLLFSKFSFFFFFSFFLAPALRYCCVYVYVYV